MTQRDQAILPARYTVPWRDAFYERTAPALNPGAIILDVGSGRKPALDPSHRPPECRYIGLDISRRELELAPPGAYDEVWVSDITERVLELEDKFDLVVSWQVLEHVRSLPLALENLHAYLRPGGRLVALLSGRYSAFGLVNSIVPSQIGVWGMERLLGRNPESVFPAFYDQCWYSALDRLLQPWSQREVLPRYNGATYFKFSRPLQRLYLTYEEWCIERNYRNLATHYLINAVK